MRHAFWLTLETCRVFELVFRTISFDGTMVQTDTKRSYVDCNTLDVIDFMVTLGRFELPTCGLGNLKSKGCTALHIDAMCS